MITVDTGNKLTQLQGMADTYKANDKELRELQDRVDVLNQRMTEYLTVIQQNSDRYRQCTS